MARIVLISPYLKGGQIAAELGTTERAVEGRLYRIKKALRKALGGDDA